VSLVAPSQTFGSTSPAERRRFPRVELSVAGNYMLRSRNESACWSVDLSPGGIAVLGFDKGMIGERIVANFSHIGWVEGMIARNFDNCFAFALRLGTSKRRKFAQTLEWLTSHPHSRGAGPTSVRARQDPSPPVDVGYARWTNLSRSPDGRLTHRSCALRRPRASIGLLRDRWPQDAGSRGASSRGASR